MRYETVGLGLTANQEIGVVGNTVAAGVSFIPGVGPIIGVAVSVVTNLINAFFQPNLQKIKASNDANQIEPILQQNLANWFKIPTNQRYASVQAAALQVYNAAWSQYVSLVTPLLNKAPNSISDRQQGSCAYHTAQCAGWDGDTYVPNMPNQSSGCCWNWYVGYYEPIANDPNVIADPVGSVTGSAVQSIANATGFSDSSIYLVGGAALLLLALSQVKL